MKQLTLLPTDSYHAKCRQTYIDKETNELNIVWTIDAGEFKWRNLVPSFTLDEVGMAKLENMTRDLGKVLFPSTALPFFQEQFIGWRGKLKVDRIPTTKIKKNVIMEYGLPEIPEEIDVTKPKSDEHFFHKPNNKRKLPIQ